MMGTIEPKPSQDWELMGVHKIGLKARPGPVSFKPCLAGSNL